MLIQRYSMLQLLKDKQQTKLLKFDFSKYQIATHTCPSSWAMVKAALRPLSWTIAQLLRLHMVPSSARPSVSQFSLSNNGCLQIFSLKWKDHITA